MTKKIHTDLEITGSLTVGGQPVSGGSGVPETLIDAKGDILVGSAADTAARLPVGANGQMLTADSAEATGLKWVNTAAGSVGTALGGNVTVIEADGNTYILHTFTNSGTLTVSDAPVTAEVLVVGGGGGGGNSNGWGGGGGGAGRFVEASAFEIPVGAHTITVGGGGGAATNGGNSSVGSLLTALGGGGGGLNRGSVGSDGGSGGGGTGIAAGGAALNTYGGYGYAGGAGDANDDWGGGGGGAASAGGVGGSWIGGNGGAGRRWPITGNYYAGGGGGRGLSSPGTGGIGGGGTHNVAGTANTGGGGGSKASGGSGIVAVAVPFSWPDKWGRWAGTQAAYDAMALYNNEVLYLTTDTVRTYIGNVLFSEIPTGVPNGGTTGQLLAKQSNTDGDLVWVNSPSASTIGQFLFSRPGAAAIVTGVGRMYNPRSVNLSFVSARASVNTAPTGASLIVAVIKNGVTTLTTLTITAGSFTSGRVAFTDTIADGDYITINITQFGTTVPGSDLVVQLEYA